MGASARVAEVELLEKRDTAASLRQLPRRARSDDAAANDGYIGLLRRHRPITVCELLRRRLSLSLLPFKAFSSGFCKLLAMRRFIHSGLRLHSQ